MSGWTSSGATTGRSSGSSCDEGRFTDVRLYEPRFHGDGRADWDVMVTITYRDWAALEAHSEADLKLRLYPDQERFLREEARRFELLEAHWDVALAELELPTG